MEQKQTTPQPPPVLIKVPRTGIIDRLKAAVTSDEIGAVVAAFQLFENASDKTKRRFARVAKSKGVTYSQFQDETIIEVPWLVTSMTVRNCRRS